jgi:hypothetical protein
MMLHALCGSSQFCVSATEDPSTSVLLGNESGRMDDLSARIASTAPLSADEGRRKRRAWHHSESLCFHVAAGVFSSLARLLSS